MNIGSCVTLADSSLYETALQYSANAIALCEAIRDDKGMIIDFRYLLVNRQYEKFSDRNAGDIRGQLVSALFPNALASDIWKQVADVVLTGREYRQEIYYTISADYAGWFDVTISQLDANGAVLSFLEISDQKACVLAERRQTELLEQVIKNSLNGIWVLVAVRNTAGKIIDFQFRLANRIANLPAMPDEQLNQSTLLTLFPAVGRLPFPGSTKSKPQTIFERYAETVTTGTPVNYDVDYQYDGVSGWYWISVCKMNDGLIVTFLDISDLKRAQQQLERTNRELRQTNHNLDQFAYVSSHDLQEPLRKIQSFGDILTDRLNESNNTDAYIVDIVRRMQSSAHRMQGLVKDLLAYSRLTTRQEEFDLVLLNRVLTESLNDLQPIIEEKQAIIEADALPTIPGDAAQLRQLFFCLINNGLKFHKPGMPPQIDVSAVVADEADLPTALADLGRRYVALSILDNGIGFDNKYTDRIFTIFQRLHGRGHYDGTGIGLALARKISENHGGMITAHSHPGRGAVFTAWLPVD